MICRVSTPALDLAYEEHGPAQGDPVILLHGFPYDPRCYDGAAALLAARGCRVIVPYLRGYGATRFAKRGRAALGPAGGPGAGSVRPHGCAVDPAGGAGRL